MSATERERETWSEKESNRKRTRTNRELHSGPIHRHIIQSDMTIRLCDPSIHIGPRQPVTDASFTPTQRHTSTLPLGLHCYQAFISLQQILLRVPTHIHSQFPPPLTRTHCKDFLWSLFLQADRYQTAMSVFYCQGWSESLSISKP